MVKCDSAYLNWNYQGLEPQVGAMDRGPMRIFEFARKRLFWPTLRQDLQKRAKECHNCAISKDLLPIPKPAPYDGRVKATAYGESGY